MTDGLLSANVDPDGIGGLTINGQRHINLAAPDEAARQAHIDLIESDKAILRAGKRHLRINTTK